MSINYVDKIMEKKFMNAFISRLRVTDRLLETRCSSRRSHGGRIVKLIIDITIFAQIGMIASATVESTRTSGGFPSGGTFGTASRTALEVNGGNTDISEGEDATDGDQGYDCWSKS